MFIAFFFIQVTQQKFYHFILLFEPRTKIEQTTSHEKTLAPKKKKKKKKRRLINQ